MVREKFYFSRSGNSVKKKLDVGKSVKSQGGNFVMNTHDTFFYHSPTPLYSLF